MLKEVQNATPETFPLIVRPPKYIQQFLVRSSSCQVSSFCHLVYCLTSYLKATQSDYYH